MESTAPPSGTFAPPPSSVGFGWRVAVSISSFFGWICFLLLYYAFWAGRFSGVQTAVVILVSILVFLAVNGATWAPWGTRQARARHA